jgi:polyphosphate kinase
MVSRASVVVVLSAADRARLAAQAAGQQHPALALRSRIVLACADGQPNARVAADLGVSRDTVRKWRSRFAAGGPAALRDAPRPGAPRVITDEQVRQVIARTTGEPPPAGLARWTTRAMASASGLSQSAVSRIWRAAGLTTERLRINDSDACAALAVPGNVAEGGYRPSRLGFSGTGDNECMIGEEAGSGRDGAVAQVMGEHGWAGREQPPPAAGEPAPGARLPDRRFFDREASWLRFNQRVLELAEDDTTPLLERVRFLSIFASNLDEFFMVRVAGRVRRMVTGLPVEGASGLPSEQVLINTLETARELSIRHADCYRNLVLPALAEQGIEILRWKELSAAEQENLQQLFRERIYPVLTPLLVDPAHPFPYISGLSLSLAVMIADPRTGATMFARVKVPPLLPRFVTVGQGRFVPLEDVIAAHLTELFAGCDILEHHVFRVTRTRELEVDEDVTENLMQSLERELQKVRFEPAVRLEVEESISGDVLAKLVTELGMDQRAVYYLPGPLDLSGLSVIADLDRRQLKYPAFVPSESALPEDTDIFTVLSKQDVLVHHPYDSFTTTVERLIVEAAADPRVLAIKQTLYRTSDTSSIVDALIDAAEAGKQVVVVVELKARFDERANIIWARKLEEAGCHVVYGSVTLKTHAKMALVVRQEHDGTLRRYCHIGTGNYHPTTARLYEDFGLLTAERTVGEDASDLFNHLTGYSRQTSYRRFLVAPAALRSGLLERIERQAARHAGGEPARIQLKCNSIVDEAVIDALYRASMAGVPVDLWVRGICALRPGMPGVSETIRVRSVLGRFLEHSRVYVFGDGQDGDSEVWIGSADLMHRNLDRRVEALVRVADPAQQTGLRNLIGLAMDEGTASWWLAADGTWTRHHRDQDGNPLVDLQQHLIDSLRGRAADD